VHCLLCDTMHCSTSIGRVPRHLPQHADACWVAGRQCLVELAQCSAVRCGVVWCGAGRWPCELTYRLWWPVYLSMSIGCAKRSPTSLPRSSDESAWPPSMHCCCGWRCSSSGIGARAALPCTAVRPYRRRWLQWGLCAPALCLRQRSSVGCAPSGLICGLCVSRGLS
jgi:hypothetical protein